MDTIDTSSDTTKITIENTVQEVFGEMPREEFLVYLRRQRDLLLNETDWTVLPDSPLSLELREQYLVYRQALRDLPQNTNSYETLVWPTRPA
jgi:hypothetical protein